MTHSADPLHTNPPLSSLNAYTIASRSQCEHRVRSSTHGYASKGHREQPVCRTCNALVRRIAEKQRTSLWERRCSFEFMGIQLVRMIYPSVLIRAQNASSQHPRSSRALHENRRFWTKGQPRPPSDASRDYLGCRMYHFSSSRLSHQLSSPFLVVFRYHITTFARSFAENHLEWARKPFHSQLLCAEIASYRTNANDVEPYDMTRSRACL